MGYVHFVRSPYAHAKIVSVDVSAAEALEGVYGTLTPDEVAELTDPFFELTTPPGSQIKDYALAVGRVRHIGEPVVAVVAATRELARDAADLVEVEYEPLDVIVDARRAQDEDAPVLHEDAGTNVVWSGTFDWGDVDGALKAADRVVKIKELHFDRFSSTPLECSAALVEYDRGTGQFTIHCNHQMPGVARDLDGAGAARPARQAPLRHAGHRRRLRQQDHDAHAADRLLPARPQAEAADPVDGVAHRPAHRERARQRALVPRHRGRRPERRDDARLQGQGARRLRRVPALRAARLHHLGAGHARPLPLAEHPRRLHAGGDEQVAGGAEPRLLADAAALADRADLRHRRPRARARPGRGQEDELRQDRGDAVRDAERLRLRLGRLRALPRHRARADRLRQRARRGRRSANGKLDRDRDRLDARLRARTTSASRRSSTRSSSSPGTTRWRRSSSTSSARSSSRSAPCRRARATRRSRARSPPTSSASRPTRSTCGPGHDSLLELARRASRGRTRASSRSPGSRRSRARPRSSRSRSAGSRAACSAASTRTTSSSRAGSRRSDGQPGGGAPVHGLRRDHQREQRGAPARAARHHAQLPPRLRAAVRDAGLRDEVRQPDADLRDADPRVRRRDRPGDGRGRDRRLRGGGRLRHPHPPADRRGPGARRDRPRDRRRACTRRSPTTSTASC